MSRVKAGFAVPTTLEAAAGALKDLGRRNTTYAVIEHDITCGLLEFATKYIPSVIDYFSLKRGNNIVKILEKKRLQLLQQSKN